MKVTLEKNYRKYYTLEDLDRAKRVIAAEKEDESTVKEWAEMAIREAIKNDDGIYEDYIVEIFKAEAHTAKNHRVWNAYGYCDPEEANTQDMDVWIEFAAELEQGFIKGGAYLSDIWQTGGTDYREHMYIRRAEFV